MNTLIDKNLYNRILKTFERYNKEVFGNKVLQVSMGGLELSSVYGIWLDPAYYISLTGFSIRPTSNGTVLCGNVKCHAYITSEELEIV